MSVKENWGKASTRGPSMGVFFWALDKILRHSHHKRHTQLEASLMALLVLTLEFFIIGVLPAALNPHSFALLKT